MRKQRIGGKKNNFNPEEPEKNKLRNRRQDENSRKTKKIN
jgi:hypothetical protein